MLGRTGSIQLMPAPPPPLIDLLFVVAPHCLLLDVAGPAEAFQLANLHRQRRGLPPRFRLRFTSVAASVPTSVGLTLAELEPLPESLPCRPGWCSPDSRAPSSGGPRRHQCHGGWLARLLAVPRRRRSPDTG